MGRLAGLPVGAHFLSYHHHHHRHRHQAPQALRNTLLCTTAAARRPLLPLFGAQTSQTVKVAPVGSRPFSGKSRSLCRCDPRWLRRMLSLIRPVRAAFENVFYVSQFVSMLCIFSLFSKQQHISPASGTNMRRSGLSGSMRLCSVSSESLCDLIITTL